MSETNEFRGCVIGESLLDPTIVNELGVWRAWITSEQIESDDEGTKTRWHIYWVSCAPEDIDRIRAQLKPWKWYAHFWRADRLVVVYCDARFEMSRTDRSTWAAALAHGRAKGVPEEQLDFLIL